MRFLDRHRFGVYCKIVHRMITVIVGGRFCFRCLQVARGFCPVTPPGSSGNGIFAVATASCLRHFRVYAVKRYCVSGRRLLNRLLSYFQSFFFLGSFWLNLFFGGIGIPFKYVSLFRWLIAQKVLA